MSDEKPKPETPAVTPAQKPSPFFGRAPGRPDNFEAGRKAAPDFSRARSEPVRLDSDEYLQFEQMQAGHPQ